MTVYTVINSKTIPVLPKKGVALAREQSQSGSRQSDMNYCPEFVLTIESANIARTIINSVKTRCIVKGEAQKSPLFWRFSGGFLFSQDRLFSRNSTRKPLNLIKSPIFTNAPCKTTCLYNAPSMHTLEIIFLTATLTASTVIFVPKVISFCRHAALTIWS